MTQGPFAESTVWLGLPIPNRFALVAGSSEGRTPLNAFDGALLASGIGNVNLLRVSSILPPGARFTPDPIIPPGSLVPAAYGFLTSQRPGERIAAAVGVAVVPGSFGVIMEHTGPGSAAEMEAELREMLHEAFAMRRLEPVEVRTRAVEHTVDRVGCVLAAVILWYGAA